MPVGIAPTPECGGIAQLVERLNGIQKVRGSTPLTSTSLRDESSRREGCHAVDKRSFEGGLYLCFRRLRLGKPQQGSKLTPERGKTRTQMHYVYIIRSEMDPNRHYTGLTQDVPARLEKHNEGGCPHTAKSRPWFLETTISFRSRDPAAAFEKYLKSGSGRELARRHF